MKIHNYRTMSEPRWIFWDMMNDTLTDRYTVYYVYDELSVKHNDIEYTLDTPLYIPEECHMIHACLNGPVLRLAYYDGPTCLTANAWRADVERFSGNKRPK